MAPHRHQLEGARPAGVGEAEFEGLPQGPFGGGHGRRRVAGDEQSEGLGLLPQVRRRLDHLTDHSQLQRSNRADALMAPNQRHAHHRFRRHLVQQTDRLKRRDLADRDVRIHERGAGGRDDDVGVGHKVQSAAGADTVDGGDDRLAHTQMPGREPQFGLGRPSRLFPQGGRVAGELHHVQSGLKRPTLTGVDDDPDVGVSVELDPGCFELPEHRGVHGVGGIGPVEDQPPDRSVPLNDQGGVGHRRPFLVGSPADATVHRWQ